MTSCSFAKRGIVSNLILQVFHVLVEIILSNSKPIYVKINNSVEPRKYLCFVLMLFLLSLISSTLSIILWTIAIVSPFLKLVLNNCCFIQNVRNIITGYCPVPINSNLYFIDWIGYIWKHEKIYNKSFHRPLEKKFTIAWFTWTYRNSVVFRKFKVKPGHIINLVVHLFDDKVLRCGF